MSVSRWVTVVMDMLLVIFTVYLFFLYFGIFFRRNENKIRLLIGIIGSLVFRLLSIHWSRFGMWLLEALLRYW